MFLIITWIFHPQHRDVLKKAPFPPGLPGDARQPSYADSSNPANIISLLGTSQVWEETLHILDVSGSWCGARKNEARAAEKRCTQRSLAVLGKEHMRVWYLAKDPLSIKSSAFWRLTSASLCTCVRAHMHIWLCARLSSSLSPLLSVSLSVSWFLSHTLPSPYSPVPFRLLFSSNLSFQVADRTDKRTVPDQEWCHLS